MFKSRIVLATILMTGMLGAGAAMAENVIQTGKTSAGKVLTDSAGMTLYTFDNDTAAVSNCNGDCAVKWPPLEAKANARPTDKFGIIIRADGSRQWAYKGEALYTWFKDEKPGDITGDGVKGVWHLAKP
mgnify:CR=1 FL=1|tara:strand:- start:6900 stop:7286 length:387 start_codon:yes stop_codon:yes gene_type:complete